jgi:hypothetical protein
MEQQPSSVSGDPYSPQTPAMIPPNSIPPLLQGYPSQPPRVTIRSGNIAFILGSVFGLVLGVSFVVLGTLLGIMSPSFDIRFDMLLMILWGLPLLIQWMFYFLGGILASWRTGKVSTGVFASFWVNLWYLLSSIVVYFILRTPITRPWRMMPPVVNPRQYTTFFLLSGSISLLFSMGLGAGLGSLGGLIGKSLSKRKSGAFIPPQQGLR